MAHVIAGDRVGRQGKLGIGCSGTGFDDERRLLLLRRSDNGRWAVPGGYMEPGESTTEACIREVVEETGLVVEVVRLVAVYTNPHLLLTYPDGNRWQLVILPFEARLVGGTPALSDETTAVRFVRQDEADALEMSSLDRLRVADAFADEPMTRVYDQFYYR